MNYSIKKLRIVILGWLLIFCFGKACYADTIDELFFNPNKYDNVLVKHVISADEIILETREKIRLIGLKAPEPPRRENDEYDKYGFAIGQESPVTPIEEQAFDFAQALLENKYVRLEFDEQKKDDDFATLAYVFLVDDNTFVNVEIIKQGFAHLRISPPNFKYADLMREAYKEARREMRGLQGE